MPDATLKDFSELAAVVAMLEHPILPRPHWGQDAAMVAFFIDRMQDRLEAAVALAEAARRLAPAWQAMLECDDCTAAGIDRCQYHRPELRKVSRAVTAALAKLDATKGTR